MNGAVTREHFSSFSVSSGWTPEVCCSWTSQECVLRSACRIAWTAIEVQLDAAHIAPWTVARTVLSYERRGFIAGSRLQPSHGVAGKICYASRISYGFVPQPYSSLTRKFLPAFGLATGDGFSGWLSRKGGVCHEDIQSPRVCACVLSHRGQR